MGKIMTREQVIGLRESYFSTKRRYPVAIARNGSFIGLYVYSPIHNCFCLSKKINDETYCIKDKIPFPDTYDGYGKPDWACNNFAVVPYGYDLRKKEHLNILIDAFNQDIEWWRRTMSPDGSHKCIQESNPNPKRDMFDRVVYSY